MSGIVSTYDIAEIIMESHVCYLHFKMNIDKMERSKKRFWGRKRLQELNLL